MRDSRAHKGHVLCFLRVSTCCSLKILNKIGLLVLLLLCFLCELKKLIFQDITVLSLKYHTKVTRGSRSGMLLCHGIDHP